MRETGVCVLESHLRTVYALRMRNLPPVRPLQRAGKATVRVAAAALPTSRISARISAVRQAPHGAQLVRPVQGRPQRLAFRGAHTVSKKEKPDNAKFGDVDAMA